VWRDNLNYFIDKYAKWSSYTPEENGVCIAYASIYGHTENAAEILATKLRERGVKVELFDTSVTPTSDIVAACFKYSHLVFASSTYNMGIFITMEQLILDLVAHNIQNRKVAIIENGSWAPNSGKLIRAELDKCKNIDILDTSLTIKSALKPDDVIVFDEMAEKIANEIK
jgi:flavorubredoxin